MIHALHHGSLAIMAALLPMILQPAIAAAEEAPLSFSLIGSSTSEHWHMGGLPVRNHINRLGLSITHQTERTLHTELHGGYLEMDQESPRPDTPQPYTGQYLGVGLKKYFWLDSRSSLAVLPGYTYHSADDNSSTSKTNIRWHQWDMNLKGTVYMGAVSVAAGGYMRVIDGNIGGTTSNNFHSTGSGTLLEASYHDQTGGIISILYSSGVREYVQIMFSRLYR